MNLNINALYITYIKFNYFFINIIYYNSLLAYNMANDEYCGKPYKIIDSKREHKIGIVASSLTDFISKGR